MTLLIELEPAEMGASSAFSNHAEPTIISVTSASFSCPKSCPLEIQTPLTTRINFNPVDSVIHEGSLQAVTAFEYLIGANLDEEQSEAIIRIECVLSAIYQLAPDYAPNDFEQESFHKANVVFNCWPFFREFVLSACSRMNIPSPPVPFLRVAAKQAEKPKVTKSPVRPAKRVSRKRL